MPDRFANFVEYWLPVFIPIFLTLLTVLAGIVTKRIELRFTSLLRIHSDLILGLFSFIIWAFISYQQTGKINLNSDYTISLVRIILLLFADFFFLIIGLILLNHNWEDSNKFGKLGRAKIKERVFNGGFLALTVILVFLPISLSESRPPVTTTPADIPKDAVFRVIIPYFDEPLARSIGTGKWGSRLLCEVSMIHSSSEDKAIEEALKAFKNTGRDVSVLNTRHGPEPVMIHHDKILARLEGKEVRVGLGQ